MQAILMCSALALATWRGGALASAAACRAGCMEPDRVQVAQAAAPEPQAPLSLSPPLESVPDAAAVPAVPKPRKKRSRDAGRIEGDPPTDDVTPLAEPAPDKPARHRRARIHAPGFVVPSEDVPDQDVPSPVPLPPTPTPPPRGDNSIPMAMPADPARATPLPAFLPAPPLALPLEALSSSLDVGPLVFVPADSDRIIARSRREQKQTLPEATRSLTIQPPIF